MWASVKWWIFFPFIPPLSPLLCFLSFAGLCGWGFGHICSYKFQPTNMTSLLCIAEALDLEALVLIVGDRSTEHQNAQTRKIFSCLLWRRDFFGTVNKLEALQLGIASYIVCNWNNFSLNRFGRGKNQTEPKLIGWNRFSVRFKNLKKIGLVFYFSPKPDDSKMLSPSFHMQFLVFMVQISRVRERSWISRNTYLD